MSEQTALAHRDENQALVTHHANGTPLGLEDIENDVFPLPRLSIVQTAAQKDELSAELGCLYLSATLEAAPTMDVIILGVVKTRALLPPYKPGAEVEPSCRSSNFTNPDEKFVKEGKAPSSACATCPKAQWSDNGPPECSENWNLFGVTRESIPFVFSCRKTAIKSAKNYLGIFKESKRPTYGMLARIEVKAVDNYFVPVIKPLVSEKVPPEFLGELAAMIPELIARLRHTQEEADTTAGAGASAAAHADPPPPPVVNLANKAQTATPTPSAQVVVEPKPGGPIKANAGSQPVELDGDAPPPAPQATIRPSLAPIDNEEPDF